MMDPGIFRSVLFPGQKANGGQELIAIEILAALKHAQCSALFMPYLVGGFARFASWYGISVMAHLEGADSLYLGTPTIVNNRKLFPESALGEWTKAIERAAVKLWCDRADKEGLSTIITGLGSGDISLEERIEDMVLKGWTRPHCFCTKEFDTFTDWLIITKRI